MGIFGKKKLTEAQAASRFVLTMTKGVQQHWPSIATEINGMLSAEEAIAEDQYAGFEFVLAAIACQIQALPNLLPADQARRIRQYIMQCISSPELGEYPSEAIQEYQDAWDQSLQQAELPSCGIAAVLFDKLGSESSVELGDASFKNPLLLMALSEKIVFFGGPWWKNVIQKYRLVP